MKIYIAAPFFNPDQVKTVEKIKEMLIVLGMDYFSPKDECMYEKGQTDPRAILDQNTDSILDCDVMIAVTEGKDMGTLFECGFAHANQKKIVYFWENDNPELKFNLMLSSSGYSVAMSYDKLIESMLNIEKGVPPVAFEGNVE